MVKGLQDHYLQRTYPKISFRLSVKMNEVLLYDQDVEEFDNKEATWEASYSNLKNSKQNIDSFWQVWRK